jgi:hypothetical protein
LIALTSGNERAYSEEEAEEEANLPALNIRRMYVTEGASTYVVSLSS